MKKRCEKIRCTANVYQHPLTSKEPGGIQKECDGSIVYQMNMHVCSEDTLFHFQPFLFQKVYELLVKFLSFLGRSGFCE